jgi:hypothetical protein
MDLENLKAKKNTLESQKAEAEVAFNGAEVGRIEQEIINVDQMITNLESKAEHTGEATESQVQQVEDLGSTQEALNEQTAEVDEKINEVKTEAVDVMKEEEGRGNSNEEKIPLDIIEKVKGFKSIKECNSSEEYKAYYEMKKVEIDEIDEEIKQARSEFVNSFLSDPVNDGLLKDYIEKEVRKNLQKGQENPENIKSLLEGILMQLRDGERAAKNQSVRVEIKISDIYHLVDEKAKSEIDTFEQKIDLRNYDRLDLKKETIDYPLFEIAQEVISDPFFQERGFSVLISGLLYNNQFNVDKVTLNKFQKISSDSKYAQINFEGVGNSQLLTLLCEKKLISSEDIKKGILETISQMQERVTKKESSEDAVISELSSIIRFSGLTDEYKNFAKNTVLNKFNFANEQRKKDFENSF